MSESSAVKPAVYIVTSCKGGIGKSTVTANLADSLNRLGKRVLCVDVDYSNRCLDLIFGCPDRVGAGVTDLVNGDSECEQVTVDVNGEGLFFIPGPTEAVRFDPDRFSERILRCANFFACDTVIIDTPGASDGILPEVCPLADIGIVVASHMPTSIRGAEKTGEILREEKLEKCMLIINRFDAVKVLKAERQGISELIDGTELRLLGIIPDSPELEIAQEDGILASQMKKDREKVRAAFMEIASRLCGEKIPLLSFYPRFKRRRLIDPRRKKRHDSGKKI